MCGGYRSSVHAGPLLADHSARLSWEMTFQNPVKAPEGGLAYGSTVDFRRPHPNGLTIQKCQPQPVRMRHATPTGHPEIGLLRRTADASLYLKALARDYARPALRKAFAAFAADSKAA